MVLIEQVKKCQTQSVLVISVYGKILQKSPFSSMYEPVRLILLNVSLVMGISAPKNRENHLAFHQEFDKKPSLILQLLFTPLCLNEHAPESSGGLVCLKTCHNSFLSVRQSNLHVHYSFKFTA